MLLGYNTNGFAHHRLEDALGILAELGYQSVALTLDYHALDPYDPHFPAQFPDIRWLLREHGLRCVVETGARFLVEPRRKHWPTLLDPPPGQERRLDFLRKAIDIAADLRADAVSFWSGAAPEGQGEEASWERLINACRDLSAYGEARQVRLAFEPEPGMFIDTMPRFARLHEAVGSPWFGLTLDLGHLHCQGELPIEAQIERWREWLWNIHIEDMRRGVHEHLMFGEGEMDFRPLLRTLDEIGYAGGLHVELSRHSHDAVSTARQALEFLMKIMNSGEPGASATGGISNR